MNNLNISQPGRKAQPAVQVTFWGGEGGVPVTTSNQVTAKVLMSEF